MRHFIALILLLAAPLAQAESIARAGSDWVRVTAMPCTDESVKAQIALSGDDPADYRAATAEFGGQAFSACWKPLMVQRVVFLRYADGDAGIVPFDELRPVQAI